MKVFNDRRERLPIRIGPPQATRDLGQGGGGQVYRCLYMSEPVAGRETSQPLIIGRRRGLPKDRSMTKGRVFPTKGNLVSSPGGLRRVKPASAAFSTYSVKETISRGENVLRGSLRWLWMFRSSTTSRGRSRAGKAIPERRHRGQGRHPPLCTLGGPNRRKEKTYEYRPLLRAS